MCFFPLELVSSPLSLYAPSLVCIIIVGDGYVCFLNPPSACYLKRLYYYLYAHSFTSAAAAATYNCECCASPTWNLRVYAS